MRHNSPSLTAWGIVVGSCLAWTGAITISLAHLLDLPAATGWVIAGFLGLLSSMVVTFVLHGIKHASVLKEPANHASSHSHLHPTRPKSPPNAPPSGGVHPRH